MSNFVCTHTQAQKHNYTYPRYAWILYDWYAEEWWTTGDPIDDCSDGDLRRFLDRAVTVQLPEFGNGTTSIGTVSPFSKLINNTDC